MSRSEILTQTPDRSWEEIASSMLDSFLIGTVSPSPPSMSGYNLTTKGKGKRSTLRSEGHCSEGFGDGPTLSRTLVPFSEALSNVNREVLNLQSK